MSFYTSYHNIYIHYHIVYHYNIYINSHTVCYNIYVYTLTLHVIIHMCTSISSYIHVLSYHTL